MAILAAGGILAASQAQAGFAGFIGMTNGYFIDKGTGRPFIPHGIAYQTWNRPLGVWQSWDQINYDLDEMVKMGANSIRVDFVWQQIEETGDNVFQWANYDYLVQQCELRNIRMFALIGYQWPPNWFPDSWYTKHPPETDGEGIYHTNRWQSDIIGYETPEARAQYGEWISNVCARYKNSKAIAGWVVGNESGYLGLWSGLLDGYDTNCENAFRTWCQAKYSTISNANVAWGTTYANFNKIVFVDQYRAYGVEGAVWADMVQWREDSIAGFTGVGAKAAKTADTNHLISYSTVGMQWGEEDWRYHAEDRGRITAACLATNAPIDFFSVNNYPWSILGHESQNGQWGVSYTKKVAKVPVMYSETGFTSSETMWPGMNIDRQGPLIRNTVWESLECGAIGTHIFSWMDRPYITDREKGFGIVYSDRGIKPAYWVSREAFELMEQVNLGDLLMGSQDPKPDIAFLWTDAVDSQHNRYECEMQQIAGALERIGYEPNFINLAELGAGSYTNYKVIILPRNMRVESAVPGSGGKTVLDFLRTVVVPAGVNILASADIPGQQDFNGKPRTNFVSEVKNLFGVDAADIGGFETPMRRREYVTSYWLPITVKFTTNALGLVGGGYSYRPVVWKYSDECKVTSGGVVWATMDTERNKGFERSTNNEAPWSDWKDTNYVASDLRVQNNWGWQLDGSNMVQMYGDAGMWADAPAVPFGRYSASTYLRNNSDDVLRAGSYASIAIEWYGASNTYLGVTESALLRTNTPGSSWVKYSVDAFAPSNTYLMRRTIRVGQTNLVQNAALTGSGVGPAGWLNWNSTNHDPNAATRLGTSGNSWQFWNDGGIYQDITNGFAAGEKLSFGGWLYTPSADPIRGGTKYGTVELAFYNGTNLLSTTQALPHADASTPLDQWQSTKLVTTAPTNATRARVTVRCNNPTNGLGRFFADDIFVRNLSRAGGSVYVDDLKDSPAVVVKNHGAAKSAIFLYSAGDNSPDSADDADSDPDTWPWQYRYDIFASVVRDYFGVQPAISVLGTNGYLCLPEYRTTTNGAYLIQVKNYSYNTNYPNGGADQTFVVQANMLTGMTIRALDQGRIIETNSDGQFFITLPPDGNGMVLAYPPAVNTNNFVVQISDAPAVVHPFGDKVYTLKVKYDTVGQANMKLKIAFMENGDNGDGVSNEIYQVLTNTVTGNGEQWYYMWIPDPNQLDTDYISTVDGGKYVFGAWMENPSGSTVARAVPQATILEWGVRPTNGVPTNIVKGQSVSMPIEWEDLYEQLAWQNTPMTRETAYPGRVAVYRSLKTEAQFPGHLGRANQVCDWLESMGYTAGNPLDIGFDNVSVQGQFADDFNDGDMAGWSRIAGAANWTVESGPDAGVAAGNSWGIDKSTIYSLNSAAKQLSFRVQADASKTVDKAFIYASTVGVSPTYQMAVYADSGGAPAGSPLASATFTVPTTAYAWKSIDLPDFAWQAGTKYHLVISYASGAVGTSNYVRVQYVGPDAGPFQTLISTTTGSTWTAQAFRPTFRIAYTDATSFAQAYCSVSTLSLSDKGRYGQKFTLASPITVTNVTMYVSKQSTVDGDVQLNIRNWADKAVVASAVVSRNLIRTNYTWVNFPFASPALGTSLVYYLETRNLGTVGAYYLPRENTMGGYGAYSWGGTNLCEIYSSNTGKTFTAFGDDDLGFSLQGPGGSNDCLRASRIGNDDNIVSAGNAAWGDRSVQADIRYNKKDSYFSDAELYVRYVDRNNYYKVGIRNYYGFWRLKYTVKVYGHTDQTGWLYEFAKTNTPAENTWYTLKVDSFGSTNTVYFDGNKVGAFYAANFPTGKIALGSKAVQLGIWEPKQGYYFIDDDENGFSSDPYTNGPPLNMDWGYLNQFYRTLILPSVYVMNDVEASNMVHWAQLGLNSIMAMDGGVAMMDETGAADLGRVEFVFGVSPAIGGALANLNTTVIGGVDHYVTLDYTKGATVATAGSATPYVGLTHAQSLATLSNATAGAYGLIVNSITNNPDAPGKAIVFNFGADTGGQLTGSYSTLARRAFEWSQGQANKVVVELKYSLNPLLPNLDLTLYSTSVWVLAGSGTSNLVVNVPTDGIMTSDHLYWDMYTYPWEATNAWTAHDGFYSSGNDGMATVLAGKGLQILGSTSNAYAGRDWDMWAAYNTRSSTVTITYGIKDKGTLQVEDDFNDGDYAGWTVAPTGNDVVVSVTSNALQAEVSNAATQRVAITRDGLSITGLNITIEYDVKFSGIANEGGLMYRGAFLRLNPEQVGWDDASPTYFTTNRPGSNRWSHVAVSIRDGDPYLRSDVYVDGRPALVSEPIEAALAATNTTIGFVAPNIIQSGAVIWDNVRVADEEYSLTFTNVYGEFAPNNPTNPTFFPSIPDYDPGMWEHEGTTKGGQYEWFLYARGEGLHSYLTTHVYFSPRLQVESSLFPTNLTVGTNVVVPVEWENLIATNLPERLRVKLFEAFSGTVYLEKTVTVSTVTGSTNIAVTIPSMPSSSNYVWATYIYPTNAIDPWTQRDGSDDTYRFNDVGIGIGPETRVTMIGPPDTNGQLKIYSDSGTPAGSSTFVWSPGDGTFNGNFTDATAPEGTMSFRASAPSSYAGWGVFLQTNMTAYSNGYVKFWAKSSTTLKLDLETNPFQKRTVYLGTTAGAWSSFSIAITNFTAGGGLNLANMYGLFEITVETPATFYIDDVKWSLTP